MKIVRGKLAYFMNYNIRNKNESYVNNKCPSITIIAIIHAADDQPLWSFGCMLSCEAAVRYNALDQNFWNFDILSRIN